MFYFILFTMFTCASHHTIFSADSTKTLSSSALSMQKFRTNLSPEEFALMKDRETQLRKLRKRLKKKKITEKEYCQAVLDLPKRAGFRISTLEKECALKLDNIIRSELSEKLIELPRAGTKRTRAIVAHEVAKMLVTGKIKLP